MVKIRELFNFTYLREEEQFARKYKRIGPSDGSEAQSEGVG